MINIYKKKIKEKCEQRVDDWTEISDPLEYKLKSVEDLNLVPNMVAQEETSSIDIFSECKNNKKISAAPKLLCSCFSLAAHYGKAWKSHHIMFETTSKNGNTCNFCGYIAYKDYGTGGTVVHSDAELRSLKYGKKAKVFVSDWHKIDKS